VNNMPHWWQRSTKVGLDIADDAVRLLQLTRDGDGWQVTRYACEPLPPGVVTERQITNHDAVGIAISQARLRSGTRARHAVVALGAAAVMLRIVQVPDSLNETNLEAHLELEAARLLPGTPLHLDFAILGPKPDAPGQLQVLLAVADAAVVSQYVAVLNSGGLKAAVVDVEVLARARVLDVLGGQSLSAGQLNALVQQTCEPAYLANPLGGCTLADAVPQQMIAHDAPDLMLACGLALWGTSA